MTSPSLAAAAAEFARATRQQDPQVRAIARLRAAEGLHEALRAGPVVPVVRTLPLVQGPVPRRQAFGDTVDTLVPLVVVRHGALLVQYMAGGDPKTLLWNPTDVQRALRIHAFDPLRKGFGQVIAAATLQTHPGLYAQLSALGLVPDAVDVVACDQLDAQHPSSMLARFPRARFAVTDAEWARYSVHGSRDRPFLLPGAEIDRDRVDVVEGALVLGDGVALVQTGGRRAGHQALVARTAQGVLVASGNAVVLDGYAPSLSKLPGLAASARKSRHAFIGAFPMVGDAGEAMALENALADRMPGAPILPFVLPSIEVVPSWIAPGFRPLASAPSLSLGTIMRNK